MFSRRVQEEEPPKPKLHVFGVEGDDLGGLMHQCRERDPRLRRNAEDKAKAAISPFVELRCAGQTFRTSRQSHDIDPVWPDASFFFGGDGEHEPLEPDDDGEHVVECVVFSSGVLRPREIGRAKVPYHGECAPWLNKPRKKSQNSRLALAPEFPLVSAAENGHVLASTPHPGHLQGYGLHPAGGVVGPTGGRTVGGSAIHRAAGRAFPAGGRGRSAMGARWSRGSGTQTRFHSTPRRDIVPTCPASRRFGLWQAEGHC